MSTTKVGEVGGLVQSYGRAPSAVRLGAFGARRRSLLMMPVAAAAMCAFPYRANAIGPLAALQGLASVVSIVSGIAGMASNANVEKQLGEINSKLDAVMANQEQILQELRSLKVFFQEALYAQWRDVVTTQIVVQHSRVSARLDRPLRDVRDDLRAIVQDIENPAFTLGAKFDVAAFPSYASAIALLMLVLRKLQSSKDLINSLRREFHKTLVSRWMNASHPGSIYALVKAAEEDIQARIAALNGRPRRHHLSTRNVRRGRWCFKEVQTWLNVDGSLESGFTAKVEEVHGEEECVEPPGCRNPRTCPTLVLEDEGTAQIGATIQGLLRGGGPGMKPSAITLPTIPDYSDSGYAVVNEFNQARIAIFRRRYELATYVVMQSEMEKFRDRLATDFA